MGRTWDWGVVHWSVAWTLQMLQMLHVSDIPRTIYRHSRFFPDDNTFSTCINIWLTAAGSYIFSWNFACPKKQYSFTYIWSPTTNAYIHIAQILKRSANPPTPVPSVHPDRHSSRVMPVLPSVTKEPRVVPATKHINKTVLQKNVAAEPRVKHKTTRHHTIPLRHRHPVVQNKLCLLGHLRPTKSRLTRWVKTEINNSHFQAQSVQNVEEYQGHWACPVYYPETGHQQSLDALLRGQQSLTRTTSLTYNIGRLTQGIGKNRPAHKKNWRNKYN